MKNRNIQYHDKASTVLSCLSYFLQSLGENIQAKDILDLTAISNCGPSERQLIRLGARLGIELKKINVNTNLGASATEPLLLIRNSSFSFLVLGKKKYSYICAIPGAARAPVEIQSSADVFLDLKFIYLLSRRKFTPAVAIPPHRPSNFYLINVDHSCFGSRSIDAIDLSNQRTKKVHDQIMMPSQIKYLAETELVESHRTMCIQQPSYFGVYRKINLARTYLFLDYKFIAEKISILFDAANKFKPECDSDTYIFCAKFIVDFLSIHPFIDGNRRMSMECASCFLRTFNIEVAWENFSLSEYYFCVRAGTTRHFIFFANLIRKNSRLCSTLTPQITHQEPRK